MSGMVSVVCPKCDVRFGIEVKSFKGKKKICYYCGYRYSKKEVGLA